MRGIENRHIVGIRPAKYILRALGSPLNFAGNEDMKKDLTGSRRMRLDCGSWALLLEVHEESGLSVKDYCLSQGISVASFYQWRKRLLVDKETGSVLFSPIEIQSKASGSILVELPGGVLLRFPELPPVEYLRQLSTTFISG